METVFLKVENNLVKVLSEDKKHLLHKFTCQDLSVKGLLSQLNKEQKKHDLDYYAEDVEDIEYKN